MAFELPYGFARDHGGLITALGAEHAEVLVREDVRPQALTELRRCLGEVTGIGLLAPLAARSAIATPVVMEERLLPAAPEPDSTLVRSALSGRDAARSSLAACCSLDRRSRYSSTP